jgi:transcriptional regulator with XRE-family HTH domain
MNNRTTGRKVEWTEANRARHRAIREEFRDWHPSPEELIASGEGAEFQLLGEFRGLHPFLQGLKSVREAAGLTLAEVSRRCGIDQPALRRLENGRNRNPTLDTPWKYAAALGQQLVLSTEAIASTAAAAPKGAPRKRPVRGRKGKSAKSPATRTTRDAGE